MGKRKWWFVGLWVLIALLVMIDVTMLVHKHDTSAEKQARILKTVHKQNGKPHAEQIYGWAQSAPANAKLASVLGGVDFSGTAIMVSQHHVVAEYSHGMADAKQGIKNSPNMSYEIDSVQKSLTAAVVMSVIRTGKLSFNDRLSSFYPQITNSRNITVRELLDMTSGIILPTLTAPNKQLSDTAVVARAIDHLHVDPHKLGHWEYQPVNFTLLSGIVEQVTGESYEHLFLETLAQPLGLTGVHFAYADVTGVPAATGYVRLKPQTYTKPMVTTKAMQHAELGTGQVFMTPGDLYQMESALLGGKLLSSAEAQALYGPRDNVIYSAGYYHSGNYYLATNGFGYGFTDFLRITPDGKNAIVIMSNSSVDFSRMSNAVGVLSKWWLVDGHDGTKLN